MKFSYRSGKSILGVTLVFVLSMAACKKSTEGPKNNPVDVENCVLQSDVDYSGVVWGLSGCNRVWYNVDANGNKMPETYYYKFKSPYYLANKDSDLLEMVIYNPNMQEGARNAFGRYRVTPTNDGPVMQTMSSNFSILSKCKVKLKGKTDCTIEIVEGAMMGVAAGAIQNMKVYFGDLPDDFNVNPNTGGGGGGGACSSACGNSYSGPAIDIQIDAHCMQAYDLVCNQGKSCSSPEVQQVCSTFRGMVDCCKPNSVGTYPNCPYCD